MTREVLKSLYSLGLYVPFRPEFLLEGLTVSIQIEANIGHSEAASGIFAVMKAAMMTEKAVIPGVAGFNKLNPASR